MSWIRAFLELNKSLFLKGLLLLMAFLLGLQMGQSRLQRQWDTEKQTVQIAQAKQEQHVADVARVQYQISKEISDDYRKKSSLLANRNVVSERLLDNAGVDAGSLPDVSIASERANGDTANYVPIATRDEGASLSCEGMNHDAAQSTLMLVELQKWLLRQQLLYSR